ncbi:MAG: GNAT family N-acetyltransferase [Absicoccus sp.]|uniref:GNAT family N-acetyltransferase n=1 Tax=Absicoccus intestinalis TaxID=2926319 RepID=A0ABU4WIW3_9FIRM|nr:MULTISPECIES: GNAT family N-acetyltransferase [unclassified Absicoccus]MDX8416494.1 GNAT family N-acetyltransferase [Absicoccus sp. CLA-KB-P134]MDY3035042.1 GNAT family N-acetyltransferase [Absicoccus sp.]
MKEAVPMVLELGYWHLTDSHIITNILDHVDHTYMGETIPYPYPEIIAHWWLQSVQKKEGENGIYRIVIVDGQQVGHICVTKKEEDPTIGEIQYCLMENFQNHGIMTKACKQICKIAFEQLDITKIMGRVYRANVASCRVLEKNHFQCCQEASIRIYIKHKDG